MIRSQRALTPDAPRAANRCYRTIPRRKSGPWATRLLDSVQARPITASSAGDASKPTHGEFSKRVLRIGEQPDLRRNRVVQPRLFWGGSTNGVREGNLVARVQVPKSDARDPVILSDGYFEQLVAQGAPPLPAAWGIPRCSSATWVQRDRCGPAELVEVACASLAVVDSAHAALPNVRREFK